MDNPNATIPSHNGDPITGRSFVSSRALVLSSVPEPHHGFGPGPDLQIVLRDLRPYRWVVADNADPEEIRALDAQDLELHCPLDNGRHDITVALANKGLGTLSLPSELVWLILKHLDIPTLTAFRRVSKRAMYLVDTTLEYQRIMKRAPQIIRGALTLEASSFTLNDAYITLSDDTCTTCGERGGYIYLITCERVCSTCLIKVRRWRPQIDIDKAWNRLGEPYPNPRLVPSVVGRPGTYGTAGGYWCAELRRRVFPGEWVRKNYPSRFWDAERCDEWDWSSEARSIPGTGWSASAFFVSVSVPLVDCEKREASEVEDVSG